MEHLACLYTEVHVVGPVQGSAYRVLEHRSLLRTRQIYQTAHTVITKLALAGLRHDYNEATSSTDGRHDGGCWKVFQNQTLELHPDATGSLR
jgi:hypothetical protein